MPLLERADLLALTFVNLQASPMGEPVHRRLGFETPTHHTLFAAAD